MFKKIISLKNILKYIIIEHYKNIIVSYISSI